MAYYHADFDRTFRALADPTRRAILERLTQGSASVNELARPFDMALPSFMEHLRVLEAGGLLASEKLGRVRTCWLDPAPIRAAENWLTEQHRRWESRLDRLDAYLIDLNKREKDNGQKS